MTSAAFLVAYLLAAAPSAVAYRSQLDLELGPALDAAQGSSKLEDSPTALEPNEYLLLFHGATGEIWPIMCRNTAFFLRQPGIELFEGKTCLRIVCTPEGAHFGFECPTEWTVESPPKSVSRVMVATSSYNDKLPDWVASKEWHRDKIWVEPEQMLTALDGSTKFGPWVEPAAPPAPSPVLGGSCDGLPRVPMAGADGSQLEPPEQQRWVELYEAVDTKHYLTWPDLESEDACARAVEFPAPGGRCNPKKWTAYHWLYAKEFMIKFPTGLKSLKNCDSWEKDKGVDYDEASLREKVLTKQKAPKGYTWRRYCEYYDLKGHGEEVNAALETYEQECLKTAEYCKGGRLDALWVRYCSRLGANSEISKQKLGG